VKAIIKAGGIAPATFYSYYTDKADLLLAIVEQVQDDLGSVAFWKIPDGANKAEVRAALAAAAGIYAQHRWLMRALVEGAGYDASLRAAHVALVDRGVRNIAEHIKAGQRAGTVASSLVPEDTARILAYAGEWWFYEKLGTTGKKPNKAVVDSLTEIFWRTLYEGCRSED
jgi:AcrR family transcriptional regulator